MCKLFMNIRANPFHFKKFISVPQCPTIKVQPGSRAERSYPVATSAHSSLALRRLLSKMCARNEAQVDLPGGQPES